MISVTKQFLALSFCITLSACGGGGGSTVESDATTSNLMTLSGSVGDGPIVGAAVTLKAQDGSILATTTSDQRAGYTLSAAVDAKDFPLILEASSGTDLVTGTVPDFTMLSVVLNRNANHININPHSTLIVKTANVMQGGIDSSNLEQARKIVITALNFGLDTDLIDDPIATQIDSGNLPTVTYASEALAESIRRIHNALNTQTGMQDILNSLAADLVDGELDGHGAAATQPSLTQVAQSVGLQVLLESMLQDLQVNGVSAETRLANAIATVLGVSNKPSRSYRSNMVKWPMLKQARAVIKALQEFDDSVTLSDLKQIMVELGTQATYEEIVAALAKYGMDHSITQSFEMSNDQVSGITTQPNGSNEASVTSPEVTNTAPTAEVPADTSIGLQQNIASSISDGDPSTNQPTDNSEVNPTTNVTGSAKLSWEIPDTRTDGSPLSLSEIAGYRVYIGRTSNELNLVLDLNESSITSYTLNELSAGTYYFSLTTYDIEGNESAFSNIVTKTIM